MGGRTRGERHGQNSKTQKAEGRKAGKKRESAHEALPTHAHRIASSTCAPCLAGGMREVEGVSSARAWRAASLADPHDTGASRPTTAAGGHQPPFHDGRGVTGAFLSSEQNSSTPTSGLQVFILSFSDFILHFGLGLLGIISCLFLDDLFSSLNCLTVTLYVK